VACLQLHIVSSPNFNQLVCLKTISFYGFCPASHMMSFTTRQTKAGQPFWFQLTLVVHSTWLTTMCYLTDSTAALVSVALPFLGFVLTSVSLIVCPCCGQFSSTYINCFNGFPRVLSLGHFYSLPIFHPSQRLLCVGPQDFFAAVRWWCSISVSTDDLNVQLDALNAFDVYTFNHIKLEGIYGIVWANEWVSEV